MQSSRRNTGAVLMEVEKRKTMWEILSYIEQVYHETSVLPTKEKLASYFDMTVRELAGFFRRQEFKEAFAARGLPEYKTFQKATKVLTPMQLAVANVILNTHDRTTLKRKLQAM